MANKAWFESEIGKKYYNRFMADIARANVTTDTGEDFWRSLTEIARDHTKSALERVARVEGLFDYLVKYAFLALGIPALFSKSLALPWTWLLAIPFVCFIFTIWMSLRALRPVVRDADDCAKAPQNTSPHRSVWRRAYVEQQCDKAFTLYLFEKRSMAIKYPIVCLVVGLILFVVLAAVPAMLPPNALRKIGLPPDPVVQSSGMSNGHSAAPPVTPDAVR